jgi:SAM-dependent methyltransferase
VACWVARRGLDVLAVDVSPVGLDLARARAEQSGLTIETRALDLHTEPLPADSFALVTCLGYLQRSLFPALRAVLAPQGVLVCGIPTVRNLERHPRPPADFLVEEGELRELVAPLEVLYYREGWIDDRCVARVAARRV